MATNVTLSSFTFQFVNGPETTAIGLALPLVCIIIVGLRLFTRGLQKNAFGMDDWLIIGGLLAVIGMGICLTYGAQVGVMGFPTPPTPTDITGDALLSYVEPTTELNQKIEFAFQILMMTAYGLIKLSILAFYRRLFVSGSRTIFDITSKVLAVVVFLWTITFIIIIIFDCGLQVWANWGSLYAQDAYCPIAFTSEYGLAISDLILDIFVILLPLPVIWKLHMSNIKKAAVSFIILLGASAIGASIARLVLYVELLNGLNEGINIDTNLSITVMLYWSMLEAGLALIAACLPTLSYIFTRYSLQSALASMRSVFSLHSTRGSSHDASKQSSSALFPSIRRQNDLYSEIEIKDSAASSAKSFGVRDGTSDHVGYAMRDLGRDEMALGV